MIIQGGVVLMRAVLKNVNKMDVIDKINSLSKMPIFQGMGRSVLEGIGKDLYLREYEEGEEVMTPDSSIHRIAIIANDARMKIFTSTDDSDEYILYCLVFGDFFNIITYMDGKKDNLFASALDDIQIFHCNIDIARSWIEKYEDFNRNLLRYLSGRLKMAQDYNIRKTFYSVELRLARLIFDNIISDDNKLNLINDLSHEEIAGMIGTSRAVVNRNLQKLKKEKLIRIERKKILVRDYERMKEYMAHHKIL